MKGCRSLTESEVEVLFTSLYTLRDKVLFLFGIKSGFRISELLSLRVKDVYQYGRALDRVCVARRFMKKKVEGRAVLLHPEVKDVMVSLIERNSLGPEDYLFQSAKGQNKPITRGQARRIIRQACIAGQITGKVATHSMRKTFANKVYDRLGKDLVKTQRALGHKSVSSTVSYLSFREEEIDEAILGL